MVKLIEDILRRNKYVEILNIKLDVDNIGQSKIGLYNIYGYLKVVRSIW